jgi:hypothetical protein
MSTSFSPLDAFFFVRLMIGAERERISIFVHEKRRRAAALQDAGALFGDAGETRSVLDCASPLALSMYKNWDAHETMKQYILAL